MHKVGTFLWRGGVYEVFVESEPTEQDRQAFWWLLRDGLRPGAETIAFGPQFTVNRKDVQAGIVLPPLPPAPETDATDAVSATEAVLMEGKRDWTLSKDAVPVPIHPFDGREWLTQQLRKELNPEMLKAMGIGPEPPGDDIPVVIVE